MSLLQYLEEQEEAEQEEEQQWKYAYGEEPETIGAGGEGCQSNYGEYLSKSQICLESDVYNHMI